MAWSRPVAAAALALLLALGLGAAGRALVAWVAVPEGCRPRTALPAHRASPGPPFGGRIPASVPAAARLARAPVDTRLRLGLPLDLNTARAEDLARLPGIGPVLAHRIVAHRQRHGPFARTEALEAVPGVGPATLARIRPFLTADPNGPEIRARDAGLDGSPDPSAVTFPLPDHRNSGSVRRP